MTAYTFYIDSGGYHDYQSIWGNPLADGDLLHERETRNSHNLQAVAIKKMIDGTVQVLRHVPIFNLFNILRKWQYYTHMRLYYSCLKFGW